MKPYYLILIIFLVNHVTLGQVPKKVTIGSHVYTLKSRKHLIKDYGYMGIFYSFFSKNNQLQAGFIKEAKKNDTTFITGHFYIEGNKLILKNYYHFNRNYPDSSFRVFQEGRNGRLNIVSYHDYKDGNLKVNPLKI